MTIKNQYTAAKTALCDPDLSLTVPPAVTASTGMDALTHAIEAFTAACSEPIADAAALYAVELIAANLAAAVKDGANLEARSKMLMGSMLGGIAFSHADVASVHCIAEALGGRYDLAHGVCNAVILPFIMEYNMDHCIERYARIGRAMGCKPDTGREGALAAVKAVRQLALDVQLPLFSGFNIDPADFPAIAAASARNISNASNPRPMSESDYLTVLQTMAG
jgi:alcohol dehydrogenase